MRIALTALALGIAALAGTAPARAEVAAKSDIGFVSRLAVEVKTTPAETWKVLTAPGQWWNEEHTFSGKSSNLYLDAQATGCFCERMPELTAEAPAGSRPGSVEHMRIVYIEPGRVLRMSGGLGPLQSEGVAATLTVTLKATDAGTRIVWEYVVGGFMRYKVDEIAPLVDRVLMEQLGRLAMKLGPVGAGRAPIPDAPATGKAAPAKPTPPKPPAASLAPEKADPDAN